MSLPLQTYTPVHDGPPGREAWRVEGLRAVLKDIEGVFSRVTSRATRSPGVEKVGAEFALRKRS
jgi:hypothetical protein